MKYIIAIIAIVIGSHAIADEYKYHYSTTTLECKTGWLSKITLKAIIEYDEEWNLKYTVTGPSINEVDYNSKYGANYHYGNFHVNWWDGDIRYTLYTKGDFVDDELGGQFQFSVDKKKWSSKKGEYFKEIQEGYCKQLDYKQW